MQSVFKAVAVAAVASLAACGGGESSEPRPVPDHLVRFSGRALDTAGHPIEGADVVYQVRRGAYSVKSRSDGSFDLVVPASDIAGLSYPMVTVVKDGYEPAAIAPPQVHGGGDYGLAPSLKPLAANVSIPRSGQLVWHLGNDIFGGPQNSRFQKTADGVDLAFEIPDWAAKVQSGHTTVAVSFLAKGWETRDCSGNLVGLVGSAGLAAYRGSDSPMDGSWGAFRYVFRVRDVGNAPAAVRFITRGCTSNPADPYDDFEITALRAEFS